MLGRFEAEKRVSLPEDVVRTHLEYFGVRVGVDVVVDTIIDRLRMANMSASPVSVERMLTKIYGLPVYLEMKPGLDQTRLNELTLLLSGIITNQTQSK